MLRPSPSRSPDRPARRTGRRRARGSGTVAGQLRPPPVLARRRPLPQAAGATPLVPLPERPARRGTPASSSRSTRCAHDVGSIAISRAIGANATNDACNVNEPDDGALTTNDPSAPEDEASRVRPSPSRSVTTTPGNGWRDAVTEPRTVQPEGACAPGMAGWSTAAHVRHVLSRNRAAPPSSADHHSDQDTRRRSGESLTRA